VVFAVILAARLAFALALPGPWFLPDEVSYLEQALAIAQEGRCFARGLFGAGQPGWPLVLAPVAGLLQNHPDLLYAAGVALSSLIGALVFWPVLALARRDLARAEATALAALAAVLPGSCLYGWALLSEPLFALLGVVAAACFVRAVDSGRAASFCLGAAAAAGAYWVRPFGVTFVLACLVGSAVWGLARARWREPLLALASAAVVLAAGLACKALGGNEPVSLTNYGPAAEAGAVQQILTYLSEGRGWHSLALALARDAAYLTVATFGVFFPLAVVGAAAGLRRFRQGSVGERAVLAAGLVLVTGTIGMSALARLGTSIQVGPAETARLYGRYLEPLLPLVLVAGAAAWQRRRSSGRSDHAVLAVLLLFVVLLGLGLPQGTTSFTNNPGFWYWYLVFRAVPAYMALALPVALWLVFRFLDRRSALAGLGLLLAVGVASTAAVARHIHLFNTQTQPMRDEIVGARQAVRPALGAGAGRTLWIDPTLCAGGAPYAAEMVQVVCWLRAGLPDAAVRFAGQDQIVSVGDLLLTTAARPYWPVLWECRGLRICRVQRPPPSPQGQNGAAGAGEFQ
jgi:hypothetical protein